MFYFSLIFCCSITANSLLQAGLTPPESHWWRMQRPCSIRKLISSFSRQNIWSKLTSHRRVLSGGGGRPRVPRSNCEAQHEACVVAEDKSLLFLSRSYVWISNRWLRPAACPLLLFKQELLFFKVEKCESTMWGPLPPCVCPPPHTSSLVCGSQLCEMQEPPF